MSEVEKENSEKISDDLEKIIKTVEEEIVIPDDALEIEERHEVTEEEEAKLKEVREEVEPETIYSIMNSINILKAEVRKIYEKVDNLENTIKYLIDSVNEIKSVILLVSHSRGRERSTATPEEDIINNITRMIELAEDAILSTAENDVARAIKIEALRFNLGRLVKRIKREKISVSEDILNRINEVLRNLDREALTLRRKITGS